MIIEMFIGLAILAFMSIIFHLIRFQKIFTIIFTLILICGFVFFYNAWQETDVNQYSFIWLTSKYYPVNIDLFSEMSSYAAIAPFFILAILSAIFMIWDKFERQKIYLCSLLAFHLLAIIMLICSQNTIQLLVSICFIDVFGFCVINNITARRQYIFYNLLADMALFMAFSMFWGDCNSILISKLSVCTQQHRLALFLVVISAFVKTGIFPFNEYYINMAELTESRKNILCFMSTPISGFLLLYKALPLFPNAFPLEKIIIITTMVSIAFGTLGCLFIKKLQQKKIYLNLILYSLAYALLTTSGRDLPQSLYLLFVLHFLQNNWLNYSRRYFVIIWLVGALSLFSIIILGETFNLGIIQSAYIISFVISSGCLIPQLYSEGKEDCSMPKTIISLCCIIYILYQYFNITETVIYLFMIYLCLVFIRPYRFWGKIYDWQKLQKANYLSMLLHLLIVSPVQFFGRILWLTIDFLIIERTFLSFLTGCNQYLIKINTSLSVTRIRNTLLFIFCSICMIFGCYYWGK